MQALDKKVDNFITELKYLQMVVYVNCSYISHQDIISKLEISAKRYGICLTIIANNELDNIDMNFEYNNIIHSDQENCKYFLSLNISNNDGPIDLNDLNEDWPIDLIASIKLHELDRDSIKLKENILSCLNINNSIANCDITINNE